MKKLKTVMPAAVILIATVCFFTDFVSLAQEGKKTTLSDHLKKLSDRVNRLKGKSKSKVTTVAGLRGEKQKKETTKSKLYWKGKSGEIPQKELAAFEKATDLALAGKTQEAINAFDAFVKTFPRSLLAPDARETLSLLKQP